MFTNKFLKSTFLASLITSVLASMLLIARNNTDPSLGFFLFFIAALVSNMMVFSYFEKQINLNIISISMIVGYIFIAFGFILNTKNHFINFLLCFILLTLININLSGKGFNDSIISRYLYIIQYYIFSKTVDFFKYIGSFYKVSSESGVKGKLSQAKFRRISIISVLFLVIGFPILFVVVPLLGSANDIFAGWVSSLFSVDVGLDIWIVRLVVIGFFLPYFVSEYIFAKLLQNNEEKIEKVEVSSGEELSKSFGFAMLCLTFVLNLFYVLFVVAELKYDFGSLRDLVASKNLDSFSQLAVGRFWELIFITLINIFIIYFGRKHFANLINNAFANIFLKVNVALLLANTIFLMFSAYQRLNLYISTYGFTYKRFEALTFLPVILVIAILMFATVFTLKYRTLYAGSIGLFLIYFGFMTMIPSTLIINEMNYSLYKDGKIEVVDPIYSVPVKGFEYFGYYGYDGYGKGDKESILPNDIVDFDGLVVAKRYLDSNISYLTTKQQEVMKDKIADFIQYSKDKSNWREFNLMKEYLKNQLGITN